MRKIIKKGTIVYMQGQYKCRLIADYGKLIAYIPLEGYARGQKGKIFTADTALFTTDYSHLN
jgi:hypothetical protein